MLIPVAPRAVLNVQLGRKLHSRLELSQKSAELNSNLKVWKKIKLTILNYNVLLIAEGTRLPKCYEWQDFELSGWHVIWFLQIVIGILISTHLCWQDGSPHLSQMHFALSGLYTAMAILVVACGPAKYMTKGLYLAFASQSIMFAGVQLFRGLNIQI